MEFEWNEEKRDRNYAKHSVTFEFATLLFKQDYLCQFDNRFDYGEDRYQALGEVEGVVLMVAYTVIESEKIRLISARKATKNERRIWEKYYYE
ncbi:MAG: BrnT family toxin [Cyanobacterium sp. T60_A2020_053]|nr:BrnT family toxin [Cyanobacterium sp. T60_A2020_053]